MSRDIETQVADDGVATLTLSRADRRNALSINLRDELTQQLEEWAVQCPGTSARPIAAVTMSPMYCNCADENPTTSGAA